MDRKGVNLHIVRNTVSNDSRVLKETEALQRSGCFSRIDIAGFHKPGYAEHEDFDGRALWRVKLKTRPLPKDIVSQALKFTEWQNRIVMHYRSQNLTAVHCHDLEPLPIAVRLKKLTGARLVYDAHELETERNGLKGLRKSLARHTENRNLKWIDAMITVSPSIQRWYAQQVPDLPVELVRNIPQRRHIAASPKDLRGRFSVSDDALLFIYLGGLARGRGIENMLAAFSDASIEHHLLLMGDGPLAGASRAAAETCDRIHYLPPVPPADVLAHAAGADVGISLIQDTCLSYRYCLPNKLFESVLAGLPVLVSDLPDQRQFVERYQAGWITSPETPAIIDSLRMITRDTWQQTRQGLAQRGQELDWQNEAARLIQLYDRLGCCKAR